MAGGAAGAAEPGARRSRTWSPSSTSTRPAPTPTVRRRTGRRRRPGWGRGTDELDAGDEHAAAVDGGPGGDRARRRLSGQRRRARLARRTPAIRAPALRRVAALPGARYGGVLAGRRAGRWRRRRRRPWSRSATAGSITRPIKGTRPGHRRRAAGSCSRSAKERAEHVMIVDLERNDLARLPGAGPVRVDELFAVRRWVRSVAGRVGGVGADRPAGWAWPTLLRAVCPGGSVTGAPKLAALAEIARLEPVGRGVSMGALGWVGPDHVDLGLSIRTVGGRRRPGARCGRAAASPGTATRPPRSPRPPRRPAPIRGGLALARGSVTGLPHSGTAEGSLPIACHVSRPSATARRPSAPLAHASCSRDDADGWPDRGPAGADARADLDRRAARLRWATSVGAAVRRRPAGAASPAATGPAGRRFGRGARALGRGVAAYRRRPACPRVAGGRPQRCAPAPAATRVGRVAGPGRRDRAPVVSRIRASRPVPPRDRAPAARTLTIHSGIAACRRNARRKRHLRPCFTF